MNQKHHGIDAWDDFAEKMRCFTPTLCCPVQGILILKKTSYDGEKANHIAPISLWTSEGFSKEIFWGISLGVARECAPLYSSRWGTQFILLPFTQLLHSAISRPNISTIDSCTTTASSGAAELFPSSHPNGPQRLKDTLFLLFQLLPGT